MSLTGAGSSETTNWISVGDLADSFAPDSNALVRCSDLVGRRLQLNFPDGTSTDYDFKSSDLLDRRERGSPNATADSLAYLATSLRPGIYFVDFVQQAERDLSVSLILDFNRGVATQIMGWLPSIDDVNGSLYRRANANQELTRVGVRFSHATINAVFDAARPYHTETTDLVGWRIRHRYNPRELYEHIYLNDKRYCWHCLEGVEAGLGDVERCHYYAIDRDLYLLVWREKIIPTLGVVMLDLHALKTTGKIFGYKDNAMTAISNFPIGAFSTIVDRKPLSQD